MPWFKVDAHAPEHPKLLALRQRTGRQADGACWGWIVMLAAAKRYGEWTFDSEEHLRGLLGWHARFLDDYRAVGLLDGLTVHNGEPFQVGSESRQAWRDRKAKSRGTPSGQDSNGHADVTPMSRARHGDVTRDSRAPAKSESESREREESGRTTPTGYQTVRALEGSVRP